MRQYVCVPNVWNLSPLTKYNPSLGDSFQDGFQALPHALLLPGGRHNRRADRPGRAKWFGRFQNSLFKKLSQPQPLFHLILSFQTHITNFTINRYVKKCPSSIQCRDSNTRYLEHDITTRPGLLP